nr:unnamed protein product [Leishmania braziliensis]
MPETPTPTTWMTDLVPGLSGQVDIPHSLDTWCGALREWLRGGSRTTPKSKGCRDCETDSKTILTQLRTGSCPCFGFLQRQVTYSDSMECSWCAAYHCARIVVLPPPAGAPVSNYFFATSASDPASCPAFSAWFSDCLRLTAHLVTR